MEQEDQYQKFHDYQWDQDKDFQSGLQHILDTVGNSSEMIFKAKTFFFAKKFGAEIDLDQYTKWKLDRGIGDSTSGSTSDNSDPDPLPSSYAHIVELILAGKPIPGIKQIPDTVLGEEASSQSTAPQRPKPWEKAVDGK